MVFAAGQQVRIKSDPGKIGTLTGRQRQRGPRTHWQVRFPEGLSYYAEDALENLPNEVDEDPLELFRQGKFGRAKDLRSQITHIRLSGRLANLIYSMETTNTEFYPYQFKPVLKFLDSPSNGLLIADEVGLGKTIEAGLIWTELRSRVDARRLMVVCPAMLREKWKTELQKRFSIKAEIVGATEVMRHFNEFKQGKKFDYALVCSMQGLRPRKNWQDEEEARDNSSALARFIHQHEHDSSFVDLLIIDEAHYMRNPESQNNELGNLLRKIARHVVLLSATPVNLNSQDLYQLLKIVDEDTFNQPYMFNYILSANEPLIRIRDTVLSENLQQAQFIELVQQARSHQLLRSNRQLAELENNPPSTEQLHDNQFRSILADRLERLNLLDNAVTRTRKREVTEWRVTRHVVPEMVQLQPEELDFYTKVTDLIKQYAWREDAPEGFLLVMPQRQIASSMPAALREWQKKGAQLDKEQFYEDFNSEDEKKEIGPLVRELITKVAYCSDLESLWSLDSKFNRLKKILTSYFQQYPKEKVVLFSYFRPTLHYLKERLSEYDISSQVLIGGMKDKQEVINNFKENSSHKVLLTSEVSSEGVDLQFCRLLINYDLPWNPMKVEQRIGRIDRLGQNSPTITIWNLFYADTIDARIYQRLYDRLHIFERTLGGLEAVLGDEIKLLSDDLLFGKLTSEQEEERIEQTAQALENLRLQQNRLEENAQNLMAHGDYILNQIRAAKNLQRTIDSEDLWIYTKDFFYTHYQGCEFNQIVTEQLIFDITLSPAAQGDLSRFVLKYHLQGQTRLTQGRMRCNFHNKLGFYNYEIETITQFHPLIRFIGEKIQTLAISYYPVISVAIDSVKLPDIEQGIYVFHAQRWSVEGVHDIEKLNIIVKNLESELLDANLAEKLFITASKFGKNWINAEHEIELSKAADIVDRCDASSEQQYDDYIHQLTMENEDRADLQHNTLQKHIENQRLRTQGIIQKHQEAIQTLQYFSQAEKNNKKISSRKNFIRGEQVKLDNLEQKIQREFETIGKKRTLKHHKKDVCIGIIKVE
jgi:hypothetical protein